MKALLMRGSARIWTIAAMAIAATSKTTARSVMIPHSARSGHAPLGLDLVPDHRCDVRPAESLDRPDAGRRGDVDLGEEAVDHVDADEQEPALAQRRPDRRANLALARGEVGLRRRAAAHHVGAQIIGRRHPVDRARKRAVDQDDALVALPY